MITPRTNLLLAAVAVGVLCTGCGSSNHGHGDSATAQTQHVSVIGNDSMRFVPNRLVVHPGTVQVTLHDAGSEAHNIDFPQLHVKSPLIPGGHSTSVTLHVKAGHTYDFDCDIHLSEGMVGTLVVTSQASKGSPS